MWLMILILITGVLAAIHYIYESIVLPNFRQGKRYDLYALRDQLRRLRFGHPDDISLEVYRYMEDFINTSTKYLYAVDLRILLECDHFFSKNPSFLKKLEKRQESLDRCQNEEFRKIRTMHTGIILDAFVKNCFGMFVYFIPVFKIKHLLNKLKEIKRLRELRETVDDLAYVREKEFTTIIPTARIMPAL